MTLEVIYVTRHGVRLFIFPIPISHFPISFLFSPWAKCPSYQARSQPASQPPGRSTVPLFLAPVSYGFGSGTAV